MRWTNILAVIFSSVWFFPVSCTTGLFTGTSLIAEIDSRDVSKGDSVHSRFSIVSESRGSGEAFVVTSLYDLRRYQELFPSDSTDSTSYLMSKPGGEKSDDTSDYSYKVLEETASGQIIEVVETYHDGDNTIWSRYKANGSAVIPVSSKMFYFGYMFAAFPYALGFSFIIYGVGRYLKSRMHKSEAGNGDSSKRSSRSSKLRGLA